MGQNNILIWAYLTQFEILVENCFSDIQNVILTHGNAVFTPGGS